MRVIEECQNCRHYRTLESEKVCTRFPPVASVVMVPKQNMIAGRMELAPQVFAAYAPVRGDQTCGEFSAGKIIALN